MRGRIGSFELMMVVAGLTACGAKAESPDAGAEVAPVLLGSENLFVAELQRLQNGPLVSGALAAERSATVRAEIAGNIVQVLAEAGQQVARGQVLGRITDDAVADAALAARSGLRTANEALVVAKRNAERSEKLAQAGAVAERELEQARWTVMNAEAALADANTRLANAEKQLGYTVLRAPFAGVISERHVNAGDNVSAGNPVFAIVDPTSLRLEAQVPVSALGSLKVGTAVPFTVDGVPDRAFEGRIIRINPAVDPGTGQVRITVGLPNRSGRLVAGLFAQGRVAVESREATVVPTAAIDRRGIRPTVTKIDHGVATRVEVVLGIEDQATERVEITSGLAVGDTVVTGTARGMQPGTKVRPSASAERPKSTAN
jgi:RND family efflux transporter MFP subunit